MPKSANEQPQVLICACNPTGMVNAQDAIVNTLKKRTPNIILKYLHISKLDDYCDFIPTTSGSSILEVESIKYITEHCITLKEHPMHQC